MLLILEGADLNQNLRIVRGHQSGVSAFMSSNAMGSSAHSSFGPGGSMKQHHLSSGGGEEDATGNGVDNMEADSSSISHGLGETTTAHGRPGSLVHRDSAGGKEGADDGGVNSAGKTDANLHKLIPTTKTRLQLKLKEAEHQVHLLKGELARLEGRPSLMKGLMRGLSFHQNRVDDEGGGFFSHLSHHTTRHGGNRGDDSDAQSVHVSGGGGGHVHPDLHRAGSVKSRHADHNRSVRSVRHNEFPGASGKYTVDGTSPASVPAATVPSAQPNVEMDVTEF